jgi:hypothetical protein
MRLVVVATGATSGGVALIDVSDENVVEAFASFDRLLGTLQFRSSSSGGSPTPS